MTKRSVALVGVLILMVALMIAAGGCTADPSDAVGETNGTIAGTPGDIYTAYNEDSRFGVSLGSGCWLIRHQTPNDSTVFYTAANMGDSVIGLVNITMSDRFGGAGPARLVAVAPNTGTECSDENTVIFLGTEEDIGTLSAPPEASTYEVVIDNEAKPTFSEGIQPVAP